MQLLPQQEREDILTGWETIGKPESRESNVITSLHIQPDKMEEINIHLQKKYREIEKNEIRVETIDCEDADYIITGYGLVARICQKAAQLARAKGIKVGVIRPITLFPFPYKTYFDIADNIKGILDVEMNAGQMVEDVKLAINGKIPVEFHGRMGGIVPTPEEILVALEAKLIGGTE